MHLFAYGTLMCPAIMRRVAGTLPAAQKATLEGYHRGPLDGIVYPAIFPRREARVEGLLYLDLSSSAWPRLDAFEGEIYYRDQVVVTMDDCSRRDAETYILRPEYLDRLGESEWSYAEFLEFGRAGFESEYEKFPAAPES
jgi:gamma-glutamylcyclotransferase (GGCT)/AIG2-like uncharacterized protein YtfP